MKKDGWAELIYSRTDVPSELGIRIKNETAREGSRQMWKYQQSITITLRGNRVGLRA